MQDSNMTHLMSSARAIDLKWKATPVRASCRNPQTLRSKPHEESLSPHMGITRQRALSAILMPAKVFFFLSNVVSRLRLRKKAFKLEENLGQGAKK